MLEFDAASNTQVDKVRELIIDNVKYAPTSGRYKIYIVDEVHMLSNSSFNALLKTLEEPPAHVIFIFATTDPQKVPLTIISRCQRFDLGRIPAPLIEQHLQFIAGRRRSRSSRPRRKPSRAARRAGCATPSRCSTNSSHSAANNITEEDVLNIFGFTGAGDGLLAVRRDSRRTVRRGARRVAGAGGKGEGSQPPDGRSHHPPPRSARDEGGPEGLRADVSAGALRHCSRRRPLRISTDRLLELIEQFAAAETRMKWAPNKKLHFEIAIIKAVQTLDQATLTEILDALTAIRSGGELPHRPPGGNSHAAETSAVARKLSRKPTTPAEIPAPKIVPATPKLTVAEAAAETNLAADPVRITRSRTMRRRLRFNPPPSRSIQPPSGWISSSPYGRSSADFNLAGSRHASRSHGHSGSTRFSSRE